MSEKGSDVAQRGASARWVVWGGSLVAALGALAILVPQQGIAADVVVYKSPTCGCCGKWVKHLEDAGFKVAVENRLDLNFIKADLGVPGRMQSCHTAKVGDYIVEGHVPADLIERLLAEKPQIRGLAVPGMPMGSPGMEGPYKDNYEVFAIGKDGRLHVYARR